MPNAIRSKYTKEKLAPIVATSCSMADVFRKLGLKVAGGSYAWIPKVIAAHKIDCSHFTGKTTNRGAWHRGGPEKLLPAEVLVFDRLLGRKERPSRLRRALIEFGVPEICAECKQLPLWCGKLLVLQIEHRNGNSLDNRPENVCFLCPNCHSQTDTYGGKKNRK